MMRREAQRIVCKTVISRLMRFASVVSFKDVAAHENLSQSCELFRQHGLVAHPCPQGSSLDVVTWRQSAFALFDKYVALAKAAPSGFGLKKEGGYREIVEKDPGRFDLNMDHVLNAAIDPDTAFMAAVRRHAEAVAAPLLRKLFGAGYILNSQGLVISLPGAMPQSWHVDSSHLFTHEQLRDAHGGLEGQRGPVLPCHFVTVFVPLYRARASSSLGPTQFLLGSAPPTVELPNATVDDQYPPPSVVERIQSHSVDVTMECEPGDVVVMDGRTLHRGLANVSSEPRPLCYMSFCPPWYRE